MQATDMKLLRVLHVQIMIPVGAEDEARRFYCGLLGLSETEKPEILKRRGGLWLEHGDFQIHLGAEPDFDRDRRRREHVAFLVGDLEAARAELVAAGIEITDGDQLPEFRRFEFRDPFGNRLELLQHR
jgi:catechol 2,3-dioxygenase-like lactoylglutathione lyase family enzyme